MVTGDGRSMCKLFWKCFDKLAIDCKARKVVGQPIQMGVDRTEFISQQLPISEFIQLLISKISA